MFVGSSIGISRKHFLTRWTVHLAKPVQEFVVEEDTHVMRRKGLIQVSAKLAKLDLNDCACVWAVIAHWAIGS